MLFKAEYFDRMYADSRYAVSSICEVSKKQFCLNKPSFSDFFPFIDKKCKNYNEAVGLDTKVQILTQQAGSITPT